MQRERKSPYIAAIAICIVAGIAVVAWCSKLRYRYPPLPQGIPVGDGDLVLFRHRNASSLQLSLLESEFSHVGIATTLPNGRTMGIAEMVARGDLDVLGRPEDFGRTYSSLADRCRTYDGIVCVRKLCRPLSLGEKYALAMAIDAEGRDEYDESYKTSYVADCVLGLSAGNKDKKEKKKKNCARFVWDVLRRIGLVDSGGPWHVPCVEPGWFGKMSLRAYSDDMYGIFFSGTQRKE